MATLKTVLHDQQECLSNCSVSSTVPLYTAWNETSAYEIEYMEIKFSETLYRFNWSPNCGDYPNTDVYLTFLCEGRHFRERGIGERCINSSQCQAVNRGSTCNLSSGKCSCQEGYLWNSNTCIEARGLGSDCTESKQCQEINAESTCNTVRNKCECQQGFIQHFNSCLPESPRKNDQSAIIVGVGILLGILGCLAVMFIRDRCAKEAQNKYDENNSGNMYEETLVQEVQVRKVYEALNSTNTLGREKLNEPEDHGIYNQVNENAIELHVLSDDGYCLPHGANADVDSHVASGYDRSKDCPGDYVEVN